LRPLRLKKNINRKGRKEKEKHPLNLDTPGQTPKQTVDSAKGSVDICSKVGYDGGVPLRAFFQIKPKRDKSWQSIGKKC